MNNRIITYLVEIVRKTGEIIANILIPKEKEVVILENFGPDGLFNNIPKAENFDFETDKIRAIFNYKTPLCRQAIWEIKYRANRKLIKDFSLLLYEYILEELSDLDTFNNFKKPILIPIPSSKSREREKGFNQCVLICQELIKIDKERSGNNFTILENYLVKKVDTAHQARVSNRKNRLKNLINTFSVSPSSDEEGANILMLGAVDYSFIIIDDVITTGATMSEAFRALKSAGINPQKIRGFALAH